jgi:regulator of replication initiation timing
MRLILLVAVALAVAAGFQTSPRVSSHIEMLNSEKRILEDELYELEYELEDALDEVDQLRTENERLNRRLGTLPSNGSSVPSRRSESSKKSSSPKLDLAPPMIDEGLLTEPKVEVPGQEPRRSEPTRSKPAPMAPSVPMTFISPVDPPSAEPSLLSLLPPEADAKLSSQVSSGPERLAVEPTDPRVTQIYLDPLLTSGSDFDRQPGDDGVIVAVQPRNQENQFVSLAGPISVALIDPTQDQATARVARWDLEARDIEQAIRASNDPGIRLRLPWPNGAPQNSRLQLFVRYTTLDGRKLEASREIFIALPGQTSQRWTPRSSGRPRILASTETTTHRDQPIPTEPPTTNLQPASHSQDIDSTLDDISPSAPPAWQPQR